MEVFSLYCTHIHINIEMCPLPLSDIWTMYCRLPVASHVYLKLNVGQITNLYTDFKLKHNLQSVFTILTHFTILSLTAMMVPL